MSRNKEKLHGKQSQREEKLKQQEEKGLIVRAKYDEKRKKWVIPNRI